MSNKITLADLFTPEQIAKLCPACKASQHWRDYDNGQGSSLHTYTYAVKILEARAVRQPIPECPCDGTCVQASPDRGSALPYQPEPHPFSGRPSL